MTDTRWVDRLRSGFRRTSDRFGDNLTGLWGKAALDDASLDDLEEGLIASDLGPSTAAKIRERLAGERFERGVTEAEVRQVIAQELEAILAPVAKPLDIHAFPRPQVILVVGVNGSGKTTTIAKLAHLFMEQDYSVLLAAGDTFRAAAIEQLRIWGERIGVPVIAQRAGADPGAVAFDAVAAAESRGLDAVLVDTAGRLQNKQQLMDELAKVRRVIERRLPGQPRHVLLVLDATTGQNGLLQAEAFSREVGVTGIVLTKLDGTAKGGVALAVADRLGVPILFAGVGEDLDALAPFDPEAFVEWLLAG